MIGVGKYDFSFTGFSLRVNDMLKVAIASNEGVELTKAEMGDGNSRTGAQGLIDVNKRLKHFSKEELDLFLNGSFSTQKKLAFLSVCKAHTFIRDFVVEVLREKLLVFDNEISEGEYISFYRRKSELRPEMEDLTEMTQNKIRQVIFKILEQAGIIDDIKSKIIQPQLLNDDVIKTIASNNKQWLKIFMMSDMDIENVKI